MAYNTKKGSQHSGDIQYEGDPNDTQIDFENDSIGLKTGGTTRVLVTDTGLSGSAGLQTVGATILGSSLSVSGASTLNAVTATAISGSGILQAASAITGSGNVALSGTAHIGGDLYVGNAADSKTLFALGELTDAVKVTAAGVEYFRIDTDATAGNSYFRGKARFGSHTVAPTSTVSVTGDVSGSGVLQNVGATTLGNTLTVSGAVSGAVDATFSSVIATQPGSTSQFAAVTVTSLSSSGLLQNVGAATLGSTLNVSGAISGSGNISGSALYVGGNKTGGSTHTVLDTMHISSSLPISGAGMFLSGNQPTIGLFSNHDGNAGIIKFGRYGGVKTSEYGAFIQYNTVNDIEFTNYTPGSAIRFNICDLSDADTFEVLRISGSGGNSDGFGCKTTSFYDFDFKRKVSGSSTLEIVGATTLGSTLNVSGTITGTSITGSKGLYSLTNGTLQVGHEEVGTGVAVKVSTTTDNSVPLLVKTPSHETLFAMTGSGKVLVGGMHFDAKLNISGSDVDQLISAAGTSRGNVFSVSASGETFISGNLHLQSAQPTIHFSGSTGAHAGQIGINTSDNILIQNNATNKHIVFKANDNGTIREGLRLDGAVPEVVVNQTPASMINFRVESATNPHMLYVSGATNHVGIGVSDPAVGVTLDISGSSIRIRDPGTPSSASDFGVA